MTDRPRTYGWTPHRDAMLARLVGAGYSWATIGRLCGRTKKAAQARWKVLQGEGAVSALMKKKKTRRTGGSQKEPTRRCLDCGRPTTDYRCPACWARLRRAGGYSPTGEVSDMDTVAYGPVQ